MVETSGDGQKGIKIKPPSLRVSPLASLPYTVRVLHSVDGLDTHYPLELHLGFPLPLAPPARTIKANTNQ